MRAVHGSREPCCGPRTMPAQPVAGWDVARRIKGDGLPRRG